MRRPGATTLVDVLLLCALVALTLYPASYLALRVAGRLVHFHYGLYADEERGREHDGVYHEIRSCSFRRRHPIDGHVPRRTILEQACSPLSRLELAIRALPAFERSPW